MPSWKKRAYDDEISHGMDDQRQCRTVAAGALLMAARKYVALLARRIPGYAPVAELKLSRLPMSCHHVKFVYLVRLLAVSVPAKAAKLKGQGAWCIYPYVLLRICWNMSGTYVVRV